MENKGRFAMTPVGVARKTSDFSRYHALTASDGGPFAFFANGMTERCNACVLGLSHGVGRAKRGDGPQGTEPNEDELTASADGPSGPAERCGMNAVLMDAENAANRLKNA